MKQTARVIVTLVCDRSCPGCCNTNGLDGIQEVNLERLKDYEEVVLTGGEPLLMGDKFLVQLIKKLRKQNKNQSIYLYTANLALDEHEKVLDLLDGITVTLHAEATDNDIRSLKYMSENLYGEPLDMRLFIDERVYDRYDLSNIRMSTWDVVRKLKWLDRCEPADNEDLLMLRL